MVKLQIQTEEKEEIKKVYLKRDEYGVKLFVGDAYVLCMDDSKKEFWFFPEDLKKMGFERVSRE
jgi:hypothetical protein